MCLIGLQKGVSKTSKGRLLEANWASFQMLLMPFSHIQLVNANTLGKK